MLKARRSKLRRAKLLPSVRLWGSFLKDAWKAALQHCSPCSQLHGGWCFWREVRWWPDGQGAQCFRQGFGDSSQASVGHSWWCQCQGQRQHPADHEHAWQGEHDDHRRWHGIHLFEDQGWHEHWQLPLRFSEGAKMVPDILGKAEMHGVDQGRCQQVSKETGISDGFMGLDCRPQIHWGERSGSEGEQDHHLDRTYGCLPDVQVRKVRNWHEGACGCRGGGHWHWHCHRDWRQRCHSLQEVWQEVWEVEYWGIIVISQTSGGYLVRMRFCMTTIINDVICVFFQLPSAKLKYRWTCGPWSN